MSKYILISAGLSLLAVLLLPVHNLAVSQLGPHSWLDMAFGLSIGLATAFNLDIIARKIRVKK